MKKGTVQKSGGEIFLNDCRITENAWERMRGLLSDSALREGQALWIAPCTSVHTLFMRFAIDAAFLDRQGKVIALYESLKPWRMSGMHPFAAGVLETRAGAFAEAGIRKGEVLKLCPSS